jgi:transposase
LTTKLHAAVNGGDRLLRLILTPGQCGDAPQAETLLEGLQARGVLADAAYDSDAIHRLIRKMKAIACVKPHPTRKRRRGYDRQWYKHRNVIERFFSPHQAMPSYRHTLREESRQLPRIHLARRGRYS